MRISDWSSDVCSSDLELAGWVRQGTGGRGVDVVFDGVGAASWQCSLAAVARRGLIISYGNASGPVPPVLPLDLTKAGPVFLPRHTLAVYCLPLAARPYSAARIVPVRALGVRRIECWPPMEH